MIHSGYTLIKIIWWLYGDSIWLKDRHMCGPEEVNNCLAFEFNEGLVQQIRPALTIVAMVLIVLSVVVNLACFKWRKLANSIMYIEFFYQLLINALPNRELDQLYVFIMYYFGFFIYYCDSSSHIILLILSQAITMFVFMPVIYNEDLTGQKIFTKLLLCVG